MNDKNTEYINESIETNNQLIETILRNKGNQMKLKSVIMRILKKILQTCNACIEHFNSS